MKVTAATISNTQQMACLSCINYIHDTLLDPIRDIKSPIGLETVICKLTHDMYRIVRPNKTYFGIQHRLDQVQKRNQFGILYKYSQFVAFLSEYPTMKDEQVIHMELLVKAGCGYKKHLQIWYMEKFLTLYQTTVEVHNSHSSKIHPDILAKEALDDLYT